MFQVDKINTEKEMLERHKFVISNPVGGNFKVSNGKYFCDITIDEAGVEVKCADKNGRASFLSTKNSVDKHD